MLDCAEPAFPPASLFATDFPIQSGYNFLDGRGGDDCCISGQRIPVQRFDRLSSGAGGGTAGGNSPAPQTLCPLRPAGRTLCSSRFPAGLRFSGGCAGKNGGRGAAGADCIRWRATFFAADDADLCDSLRSGGNCVRAGTAGRAEYPPCQRSVLHQRQWKNPSDFGVRAICASGGSFPGSSGPWDPGRANPDTGFPAGTNRGPHGAAGHRPPSAGRLRGPGADGGASLLSATGGRSVPITGCGSLAAAAPEIPGAASAAAADPYGGRQRPAAQRKKRLGVD